MTDHSPIGPSSLHRALNCTASVSLIEQMGPQKPSEASISGTRTHELLKIVLEDFLNWKIDGTDPDIRAELTRNPEDAEAMSRVYEARNALWIKGLEQSITGKAYGIEEKLCLDEALGLWGTTDFWCVYTDDRARRTALVFDYKDGYYDVSAKGNPQLAAYLCALRAELKQRGKDIDHARGVIYQPRAQGEPWKETTFTPRQLDVWEKKFFKLAEQIYVKKKVKFKIGPWCELCNAKGLCPEFDKHLKTKTELMLVERSNGFPSVERLPDSQISKIILHADEIKDFLKSAYAYGLSRHQKGDPLPGLKLVQGPSRRKWRDETHEIADALKNLGINPYQEPDLKPLTTIERELTKAQDKEFAKNSVDSWTVKGVGSEILVPFDDPREALKSYADLLDGETQTIKENTDDKR